MGTINTIGVKRLIRNGLLGSKVIDLGTFFSLQEARDSVASGWIQPQQGERTVNTVMIMDKVEKTIKFYEWSFALSDFTEIGQGDNNSGALANAFIRLTGSDEYIGFDDATGSAAETFLKWGTGNDWTLYMKIPELLNAQNQQYVNIASNGNNNLLLRMGGTNQGLYINGETSYQAGINTWVAVTANSTVIFRKTGTSLEYYLNGVYRGAINTSSYTDGNNGIIKIGSGSHDLLKGGVDNIVMWNKAISSNDLNDIHSGIPVEQTVIYGDAVVHLKCGEDAYPNVVDHKGTLKNGKLFNGRPEDFVEIVNP